MPSVNYNSEPQLHSDQISKEHGPPASIAEQRPSLWTHKSVQNQA